MSASPVLLGPTGGRTGRIATRVFGWRSFLGRLVRRPEGAIGLAIIVFFAVLALAPSLFVGPLETVTSSSGKRLEPPSLRHLLGTDNLGRDVLNLTVHGARISMLIGLLATVVTLLIGAVLGIVSGFVGGRTDTVIMRITDFFLVLPTFVLALIIAPIVLDIIGTGEILGIRTTLFVIVIVIGITSWATTARIIRSQTMSVKERAFIDRARVIGSGPWRMMRVHILPNVTGLIVANAVLIFAGAILTETTLAFIGLGDPFAPSWGQILGSSQDAGAPGLGAWWWYVSPGVCIVLVVLAFTLIGGALDDLLNPKARRRR
ncbi:MAG: ABC transporter permease [Chloroflexota bacterium]